MTTYTETTSITRWERALLVLGAGAYEEPHIQWACAEVLQRDRASRMAGGHPADERAT
ncbi:hypothetical protein GCM10023351_07410 [Microbacterium gilvum]|uniref:Uncharacterized protein n=1 Tax=Microbacterium gilvum TaxID=1336204 RepID=A0ABP8ZUZ8_9MICO